MFSYILGTEATRLSGQFLKMPYELLYGKDFCGLSLCDKLLYAFLLDQVSLSRKNQMVDEQGRLYVECSRIRAAKVLGVSERTAAASLAHLEEFGLIEQVRRGQGKCNLILVCDFSARQDQEDVSGECAVSEKSTILERQILPVSPVLDNNIINNNPLKIKPLKEKEHIKTIPFSSISDSLSLDERRHSEKLIQEQIGYDSLVKAVPDDVELVNTIVSVMNGVLYGTKKDYQISGCSIEASVLKVKLGKLKKEHILAVIKGVKQRRRGILNLRKYLLTCLYDVSARFKYSSVPSAGERPLVPFETRVKVNDFNNFAQRDYTSDQWKNMELMMRAKKWD